MRKIVRFSVTKNASQYPSGSADVLLGYTSASLAPPTVATSFSHFTVGNKLLINPEALRIAQADQYANDNKECEP
jgi:hypothetical protein